LAALNPLTRELVFKVVFYGPGLGGKTTTLQWIHANTKAEHRGKLVSLATPTDRTLYFDFLPLRVHRVRDMSVRLQLFTVPGQVYYTATRKLVLTGADGVVFVADSQPARVDANQESLEDLTTNLAEHGRRLSDLPHTFHWNKRDIPDVVPEDDLDRRFNLFGAPAIGTVATKGTGIFEGLERITKLVVEAYKADLPTGSKLIPLLDSDDIGIAEAIRGLAESPRPHRASPSEHDAPTSSPAGPMSAHNAAAGPSGASPPQAPESSPTSSRGAASGPLPPKVELAAPTVTPPPAAYFSLSELWPEAEQIAVRRAESLLHARDAQSAVLACDLLVTRILASAAGLAGTMDAPRDPGLVAMLLGLDGRRYLEFRSIVRAARARQEIDLRDAYECYLFTLEARRARDRIGR
jgi:signal recognition particle receptor subunit beta